VNAYNIIKIYPLKLTNKLYTLSSHYILNSELTCRTTNTSGRIFPETSGANNTNMWWDGESESICRSSGVYCKQKEQTWYIANKL